MTDHPDNIKAQVDRAVDAFKAGVELLNCRERVTELEAELAKSKRERTQLLKQIGAGEGEGSDG